MSLNPILPEMQPDPEGQPSELPEKRGLTGDALKLAMILNARSNSGLATRINDLAVLMDSTQLHSLRLLGKLRDEGLIEVHWSDHDALDSPIILTSSAQRIFAEDQETTEL